jgi:4-carboxymuconolactone decarboxylase
VDDSQSEYLPEIFEQFRRDFPQVAAAYRELSGTLHEAGPLDRKSRRLVKLAIAVGCGSEGAVRSHVRKALDEGVSQAEIEHVVMLGLTTAGFPKTIAALKWTREVLQARE